MNLLEKMTTPEEKYSYLLMVISDKLKDQEDTITLQKWQIDELEKKLAEANKKLAEANKELVLYRTPPTCERSVNNE